jgi:GR25 family glycosyltransferase involved in LPS biosynthesis
MEKEIKLLIMSMKKSPRLPFLTKKLQKLKIKYKIFYGINEKNLRKKYLVYKYYNRKVAKKYTGREMGFNEIGAGYTFLKILRYCLKKKLKNSIILNDDFYPSKLFKEWIDKKIYFEGKKIIGFQCFPTGFLKKNYETVLDKKIKIYEAKTHLFNAGCNQVTLEFVKEFLKITKNKVIGNGDWPFNFRKHNITLLQTLPFLFYQDNRGFSYLIKERDVLEKISFKNLRKNFYKIFGIKFANKIFNFLRIPYYILFIPFLLRKYKNLDYYMEYYFAKYFYKLINPIFNFYIDVENIYTLKSSYPKDLKKYAYYRVFDK